MSLADKSLERCNCSAQYVLFPNWSHCSRQITFHCLPSPALSVRLTLSAANYSLPRTISNSTNSRIQISHFFEYLRNQRSCQEFHPVLGISIIVIKLCFGCKVNTNQANIGITKAGIVNTTMKRNIYFLINFQLRNNFTTLLQPLLSLACNTIHPKWSSRGQVRLSWRPANLT